MFADDMKLWTNIHTKEDSGILQKDLDNLSAWIKDWSLVVTFQPGEV